MNLHLIWIWLYTLKAKGINKKTTPSTKCTRWFFYCCSSKIVSISSHHSPYPHLIPSVLPPLSFPWDLYTCSLMTLPSLYSLFPPFCLLSVCSLFQPLWSYLLACLFCWLSSTCRWDQGRGTMWGRVFRNYYKGHMDKTKGEDGSKGDKWVWLGWWGVVGENSDNCNWTIKF